jgi:hypothetical protein
MYYVILCIISATIDIPWYYWRIVIIFESILNVRFHDISSNSLYLLIWWIKHYFCQMSTSNEENIATPQTLSCQMLASQIYISRLIFRSVVSIDNKCKEIRILYIL